MRLKIICGATLFLLATAQVSAHGGGGGMGMGQQKRQVVNPVRPVPMPQVVAGEREVRGEVIHQASVGGFDLTLKLVDAKESVFDGGSHNLLVNIKRDGRPQNDLSVTAGVAYLEGEVESKSMMELGDWYFAGYDLGPEKACAIEISFRAADGTLHSSAFNYP